jgi:hypothetical protein
MGSTVGAIWLAHEQFSAMPGPVDTACDLEEYQPWQSPGLLIERLSGESLAALAWAADCTVAELIARVCA